MYLPAQQKAPSRRVVLLQRPDSCWIASNEQQESNEQRMSYLVDSLSVRGLFVCPLTLLRSASRCPSEKRVLASICLHVVRVVRMARQQCMCLTRVHEPSVAPSVADDDNVSFFAMYPWSRCNTEVSHPNRRRRAFSKTRIFILASLRRHGSMKKVVIWLLGLSASLGTSAGGQAAIGSGSTGPACDFFIQFWSPLGH